MSATPGVRQRLPNVLISGVTKAGTSSLYTYLRQSPHVFCPSQKEVNYYSPLVYDRELAPIEDYASHYTDAHEQAWRLDASPFYFTGVERIAAAAGKDLTDPRVIVSLREPAARLWSAFRYQRSQGRKVSTFAEFLDIVFAEYRSGQDLAPGHNESLELRTGRYIDYLPRWVEAFGAENAKIVFMEDIAADPGRVAGELFGWLGVPDLGGSLDTEARNVTSQPKSQLVKRTAGWANERFREPLKRNQKLYDLTRNAYLFLNAANSRTTDEAPTPAELDRVLEFYADATALLAGYLESINYSAVPSWLRAP